MLFKLFMSSLLLSSLWITESLAADEDRMDTEKIEKSRKRKQADSGIDFDAPDDEVAALLVNGQNRGNHHFPTVPTNTQAHDTSSLQFMSVQMNSLALGTPQPAVSSDNVSPNALRELANTMQADQEESEWQEAPVNTKPPLFFSSKPDTTGGLVAPIPSYQTGFYTHQSPAAPQKKKKLKLSTMNSQRPTPKGAEGRNFFSDDEIVTVYLRSFQQKVIFKDVYMTQGPVNGKIVSIHNQPSLSSAGFSCVSMALLNLGLKDFSLVIKAGTYTAADHKLELENHGLQTKLIVVDYVDPKEKTHETRIKALMAEFNFQKPDNFVKHNHVLGHLQTNLKQYPFALVSTSDAQVESSFVIVHAVDDSGVVLTDPFHGWSIKVTRNAFLKRIQGDEEEPETQTILWVKKD